MVLWPVHLTTVNYSSTRYRNSGRVGGGGEEGAGAGREEGPGSGWRGKTGASAENFYYSAPIVKLQKMGRRRPSTLLYYFNSHRRGKAVTQKLCKFFIQSGRRGEIPNHGFRKSTHRMVKINTCRKARSSTITVHRYTL